MSDPTTPEQWQDAVDAAAFLLTLDAARQYGLVTGGPQVNVGRASELLQRGAAMGLTPRADHVERGLAELSHQGR